ncbi:hypothetical protein PUN28_011302 [Cardiocondyla obscurior]|uniref:Uncharacterized protein n=1 Tax=Cardiocondyla obscurior TaxID=286306 RepID=A0AAW2FEB7_9HYME
MKEECDVHVFARLKKKGLDILKELVGMFFLILHTFFYVVYLCISNYGHTLIRYDGRKDADKWFEFHHNRFYLLKIPVSEKESIYKTDPCHFLKSLFHHYSHANKISKSLNLLFSFN